MYNLKFISDKNLEKHVKETITNYGNSLTSFNLNRFNSNTIDPVKLIFDKNVYNMDWNNIVNNELFRQRDKSNNNVIGYFHQNIFSYFNNCEVPNKGWDVIYTNKKGIKIEDKIVYKVYVEMKNKHNTMNSSSSAKTYMRMQNQILSDDLCATFLVEAIAKNSQNIMWKGRVDGDTMSCEKIRRVSMDKFYEIVTGDKDAFYKLCMVLPEVIKNVLKGSEEVNSPNDTVFEELTNIANTNKISLELAVYMLGFKSYDGFNKIIDD